jgi:hypothetical protein
MDEKGFMIGITTRSKRVFSQRQWERKEVTAALQDGSREWVTLLATVCADGTALPPGIIYQSDNSTLQAPWVAEIDTEKHNCFISSSPSGWTNNELGLVWLEQVFERCTKQKARLGRDWRLLILNGHGSHLTFEFLEYCKAHRILVVCFRLIQLILCSHLTLFALNLSLERISTSLRVTSTAPKASSPLRKETSSCCFGKPGASL